ncbi:hypothetical protein SK854_26020 [Lentzea sp. BCCO 10_0061]|uniref:Uncharacterized protein n=1 Tax=Lentzea sokolovensis TaxID=3095429 RepID=A0ABU4V3Q4_9PSEU|nr:hypothetical protein [Lentzea sp. BCCO 10_0061]MDX8145593.1 hypothetical protein [Lentzea sp. BCCO 10_0061]
MAGAVGIVFGLCVLSFTLGAALMYVLVRRREDSAPDVSSPSEAPAERTWVEKPVTVEPVDDEYDTRPIHRNPVMGLRQLEPRLEPALASLAEPVAESVAEPEPVAEAAAEPEPVVAPEPTVVPSTDSPEAVEAVAQVAAEESVAEEPVAELVEESQPEAEPEPAPPPAVQTALPPPASPQPAEHTTWVEREDFRQRYLRTFEEVRRKAGSN